MVREIDDELYQTFLTWLADKEITEVNKEMMPIGWISFLNEKPVFATYLYPSYNVAWVAYSCVNPESNSEEREESFKELMIHINSVAKSLGIKYLFSAANNQSLIKRFENNNFIKCDENIVHLRKLVE
jgi:hypothetical protein